MKVITVANQKGGIGKTTTAAILAYLLSLYNYRVLGIDMDSQGNFSELFSGRDSEYWKGKSVLTAMLKGEARPYIVHVRQNIDLLPAEDDLALLTEHLVASGLQPKPRILSLKNALINEQDNYDFAIIDTPPALGPHTLCALAASTGAIVMAETSRFCVSAVKRFITTLESVRVEVNAELRLVGILAAMIDSRRIDNKSILEMLRTSYGKTVFAGVIKRNAATGRLPLGRFEEDNDELSAAVKQYIPVVKEVLERVG